MELLFGDADITGKVIQEPINHSHDSCPQKASAKVLQEQMKDKMTAHQPLIEMLLAKHLTDVSSDVYQKRQTHLLDRLHCRYMLLF